MNRGHLYIDPAWRAKRLFFLTKFYTELWRCSTGADPITDCTTLGSVAKVRDRGQKSRKKHAENLGRFHLPNRTQYIPACLDHEPNLT